MRPARRFLLPALLAIVALPAMLAGCGGEAHGEGVLSVTASTSFLADMAQHVAGDRFTVNALIPDGMDPHTYEPGPRDIARIVEGDLFIVNGHGLEGSLLTTVENAGGGVKIVDASTGLQPRGTGSSQSVDDASREVDPHFWLDPVMAERYVTTIRDAFVKADPAGAAVYRHNAAAYERQLRALDAWTRREVAMIPPARRVLVTDHQSYGYFADRYGFTIAGTIIPTVSDEGTPTAQQLAALIATMKRDHIDAIFVGRGENTQLADQVAAETGAHIYTLLDHSLTPPGGAAPTYDAMIRYNVRQIVQALR